MNFTYLALGDSYTIGEQVLPEESFPFQTIQLLRQTAARAESRRQDLVLIPTAVANPTAISIPTAVANHVGGWQFNDPEIIAETSWTTDELNTAIDAAKILSHYTIVSLLIGVNNQYRNKSLNDFIIDFTQLLQRTIQFANKKPYRVFVLSIPDWGVTPFAEGKNRLQIAEEIDAYNAVCKTTAEKMECHYINITASQRADGNKPEFLAADELHPSAKEYAKWAIQLADTILMDNFLNDNG